MSSHLIVDYQELDHFVDIWDTFYENGAKLSRRPQRGGELPKIEAKRANQLDIVRSIGDVVGRRIKESADRSPTFFTSDKHKLTKGRIVAQQSSVDSSNSVTEDLGECHFSVLGGSYVHAAIPRVSLRAVLLGLTRHNA